MAVGPLDYYGELNPDYADDGWDWVELPWWLELELEHWRENTLPAKPMIMPSPRKEAA